MNFGNCSPFLFSQNLTKISVCYTTTKLDGFDETCHGYALAYVTVRAREEQNFLSSFIFPELLSKEKPVLSKKFHHGATVREPQTTGKASQRKAPGAGPASSQQARRP